MNDVPLLVDSGPVAWTLARLAEGIWQGTLAAAVVWVIARLWTTMSASLRAWLWWLVSVKFLVLVATVPAIPLPVLSPAQSSVARPGVEPTPVSPGFATAERASTARSSRMDAGVAVTPGSGAGAEPGATVDWLHVVFWIWLVGVAVHIIRLLAGYWRSRRLVADAAPANGEWREEAARLSTKVGLRVTPDVRLSPHIATPQVLGLRRPVVLLPSHVECRYTSDERAMVLCHELMHVRRRDLLFGLVPALAERLFFFLPFARLASREYLLAREAACDAAVLQTLGVSAGDYGSLLVRLGVVPAPGLQAAGASPTLRSFMRRLEMLQHVVPPSHVGLRRGAVALAMLAALIPFRLDARQPSPGADGSGRATVSSSAVPAASDRVQVAVEPASVVAVQAAVNAVPAIPQAPREVQRPLREVVASSRASEQAQSPAPATDGSSTQARVAAEFARAARVRLQQAQEANLRAEAELRQAVQQLEQLKSTVKSTHPSAVVLKQKIESLGAKMADERLTYQLKLLQQEVQERRDGQTVERSPAGVAEIIQMQRELERAHNLMVREQQQIMEMQKRLAERLNESAALRARIEAATAELQRSGAATTQAAPRK